LQERLWAKAGCPGKGKLRSPVGETANVIWPGMKWKYAAGRSGE